MFQRGLPLVTDQVTFEKLVNGKMALRGNVGGHFGYFVRFSDC